MTQGVILTTFIIVLFSTVSFIIAEAALRQAVFTQMASLATASEDGLNQTLAVARERATLLSANADMNRILLHRSGSKELATLLTLFQKDETALRGVEVYGPTGKLLAHAGEIIGLPTDALRAPFHRAVVGEQTWLWYDAFVPVTDARLGKIGYIALRYNAGAFVAPLLRLGAVASDKAELEFALVQDHQLMLFYPSLNTSSISIFTENDPSIQTMSVVRGLHGEEGVGASQDEEGIDVLSAYRFLPSLGWGMSVQVNRNAALAQVHSLAFSQAILGALLILLAVALSYLLGSQLTAPLRSLTQKVSQLRTGHWQMKRSVYTGDEVEALDRVLTDVTMQLQRVYKNQESEIERRTEDLKEQYALDRTMFRSIDQGVITVDEHGMITAANPAAETLLLQQSVDILGKQATDIINLCSLKGQPITTEHPLLTCLRTHQKAHQPATAQWNVRRSDGTMFPVLFAVSPLTQAENMFGAIIVLQDVTEERRVENMKTEFISLASHQLRTPLSAIRWYVELFQDEQKTLNETQLSYLKEIDTGLGRMNELLETLFSAATLEGEAVKPTMQEVDATVLLHDIEKDCQTMARDTGVSCALALPQEKIVLSSDPTLLRIVFQTLLSNAVKYTPKGKNIAIALEDTKDRVIFSVKDEGIGIPEAEQKRVFERFFRAKNVQKLVTDGTGLGLYICKSIVEKLGGEISFTSTENVGTTFTVSFPKKKGAEKKGK